MTQKGRAWIELNMGRLAHNVAQLKKLLPGNCALMPAVKADAYGHGAVAVSRALQDMGIRDFCVASVDEAIELRVAGIVGQILILGYTPPDQFPMLARYSLTQIAVAAIGYADGIPRALSGGGHALVRGRRAPVIGRVCMDQLLLDVSEISSVSPGDVAVLIGRDGGEEILASDVADQTGTISNEILSRLGKRLGRVITQVPDEIPSDTVPVLRR